MNTENINFKNLLLLSSMVLKATVKNPEEKKSSEA